MKCKFSRLVVYLLLLVPDTRLIVIIYYTWRALAVYTEGHDEAKDERCAKTKWRSFRVVCFLIELVVRQSILLMKLVKKDCPYS